LPTPLIDEFGLAPLYDPINLPKRSGDLSGMVETFAETFGVNGVLQLH
jgi:hypothetical protein